MVGAGGVLVNAKLALVIPGLPTTDDSTVKFPGALLAVNVLETASPIVSVMAIIVCRFSAKVPVAGFVGGFELGAANCTWMLGTGSPLESTTLAVNGFANAVPTTVLWPLPETTLICAGGPAENCEVPKPVFVAVDVTT